MRLYPGLGYMDNHYRQIKQVRYPYALRLVKMVDISTPDSPNTTYYPLAVNLAVLRDLNI